MSSQLRHFCFTYNNFNKIKSWQSKLESSLEELGANYYIWGEEIAPSTGTPHLQGYVQLNKRKAFTKVIKSLPGCHITPCLGGSQDNVNYCNKECTNVVEYGMLRTIARGRAKQALDWQILVEKAKSGDLASIESDNPREFLLYYRTFKQLALDNLEPSSMVRDCIWIYGKPRTGKSRAAAKYWPRAYWKNANKWWDGYRGETEVVLDDLGSFHLFELLKRWADRYKVVGESKGGGVALSYDKFIVTSNFTPQELGMQGTGVPSITIEAIQSRFRILEAIEWDPVEDDLIVQPIDQVGSDMLLSRSLSWEPDLPRMFLGNYLKAYIY